MNRRTEPYPIGTAIGPYMVQAILPHPSGRVLKARYRVSLACCGREKEVSDDMLSQVAAGKVVSGYCRECLNVLRSQGNPRRTFVERPATLAATWQALLSLPVSPLLNRDPWGMPCSTC